MTEPDDLVIDIFAGSNTTGEVCESLKRNWLSFEIDNQYVAASSFRFLNNASQEALQEQYEAILNGDSVEIGQIELQMELFS